ncbi:MAG: malonic semialdehyde reductase [Alphaproteobacteria bacterium]
MPLDDSALDLIFRKARTHNEIAGPVDDALLRAVFDLAKMGPTSANCSPLRMVFVRSAAAKEKLRPALSEGNLAKTMAAPVTAIFANDLRFFEHLPRLFPHNPEARSWFDGPGKEAHQATTAMRNGTLQAAYFLIAARALGLDCGPMSGFDNAKVDAAFFPGGRFRSNFICNIGHGDPSKLFPRSPRFDFDDVCRIE